MSMAEEKRHFTRVPFQVEAELKIDDRSYHCNEITNLSVGGCLLPLHERLKVGANCRVAIRLGGSTSDLIVQADGQISRAAPGAVAVKFTGFDPDSLFHLQNIVRYNASDADAVEKEVRDHFGKS
jgi:hypothetical protein